MNTGFWGQNPVVFAELKQLGAFDCPTKESRDDSTGQFLQTPLQKLGGVLSNSEHSSKNRGDKLRRDVGPVTRKGYLWA